MPRGAFHPGPAGRVLAASGALVFVGSLAYFVFRYLVDFGIEHGAWSPDGWRPAAIDAALFSAFALHHSAFARLGVRRMIGDLVSPELERTTYVWVASLLFITVLSWWQPVPGTLWSVDGVLRWPLLALQTTGGVLALAAARRVDPFELSGLRQARLLPPAPPATLVTGGVYRLVRHPIYLGWALFVWPAPTMTGTRLVFALVSTAYLIVAMPFEERTMRQTFGEAYARYQRKVRWRMIPGVH